MLVDARKELVELLDELEREPVAARARPARRVDLPSARLLTSNLPVRPPVILPRAQNPETPQRCSASAYAAGSDSLTSRPPTAIAVRALGVTPRPPTLLASLRAGSLRSPIADRRVSSLRIAVRRSLAGVIAHGQSMSARRLTPAGARSQIRVQPEGASPMKEGSESRDAARQPGSGSRAQDDATAARPC